MKLSHDRLDLLETFVKIGETGSLSKAARALGTTQPTVSRRLLDLERLLGCKLALRTTSAFSLTDEGRSLLVQARDLTGLWSGLSERLSGGQARPEGTLRVIGPSGWGMGFLTDAITDLRELHPELRVELTLTDRMIDLASSGAECWLFVGAPPHPDLVVRRLGAMERMLVAAPAFLARTGPITLASLPTVPFIGLTPHVLAPLRLLDGTGRVHVAMVDTPLKIDNLLATWRAVLNGAGVAAASPWMCHDDLEAGRLERVLPQWSLEAIPVHMALPAGIYRPARVTAFIEALTRRLRSIPGFVPAGQGMLAGADVTKSPG